MDKDQLKGEDYEVKADIKETAGIATHNTPGEVKAEKSMGTAPDKPDDVEDGMIDMPTD